MLKEFKFINTYLFVRDLLLINKKQKVKYFTKMYFLIFSIVIFRYI